MNYLIEGPVELSYEAWTSLARASSQPMGACSWGLSQLPIAYLQFTISLDIYYNWWILKHYQVTAYHKQASQCAISTKVAMRRRRTAVPYSEYLSIFRATRTSRNKRAVFNKPMSVVVCKHRKHTEKAVRRSQKAISSAAYRNPSILWTFA